MSAPNAVRQRLNRRNTASGFTMVEIILVVVIIMTLAAVVGPRLMGQSQKAKKNTTKIAMDNIKTALQLFETHAGRLPTTSEGLQALITKPSGLSDSEWPDKCMDEMPLDAWQTEFKYTFPSEHGKDYDLVSGGPDKQFGTADDITNYDKKESGSSKL